LLGTGPQLPSSSQYSRLKLGYHSTQHLEQELCEVDQLTPGQFVNATYERPPYTPMRGEVQQKTCVGFEPNKMWSNWEWKPSSNCSFPRFDADTFCQMAINKTVAIVGDSISLDHYLSLSHLLGIPQALPRARNKSALLVSKTCNGTSTVIGKRDFFLHNVGNIIDEFNPDVLVLNRGAHYTPNDKLADDLHRIIIPSLVDWQTQCKLQHRNCMFIWRTSVPGHPNCTQYTQPATSVEAMEAVIEEHGAVFKWNAFKEQNELIMSILAESNLTYEIMDGYNVNILRPDAHKNKGDCLHTVSRKIHSMQ
jgi:hypothetical protein